MNFNTILLFFVLWFLVGHINEARSMDLDHEPKSKHVQDRRGEYDSTCMPMLTEVGMVKACLNRSTVHNGKSFMCYVPMNIGATYINEYCYDVTKDYEDYKDFTKTPDEMY